jgi:hypothetical protein
MRNFRSGDLLWPKKKRSAVPQTRGALPERSEDRLAWEAARQRMLENPAAAGLSPEVAERLRHMTYGEFEAHYFAIAPGELRSKGPVARGAVSYPISVGHVGLLEVEPSGAAYVVEAIPNRSGDRGGVVRIPYADWLRGYSNIQVWHGRFRGLDARSSRGVLDAGLAQLGKPYDFFNFNLDDDSGFYCSKLVWMSAWRAAHIAADDDPDPRRGNRFPPWFSPKALIGVRHVELLHSPGEY